MMKMTLGEKIQKYRGQNKVTQKEFAEKVGYSVATISYIENGWQEKCSLPKFAKMAKIMNLTAEEIYEIVLSNA